MTYGPRKKRSTAAQAKEMLDELLSSRLEVVLIPSRDDDCAMHGGMIRAVQEANAYWYQEFCGLYESQRKDSWRWRKFKTKIKRQWTIRGLEELIEGKCGTAYADRLKAFIERQHADRRYEATEKRRAA